MISYLLTGIVLIASFIFLTYNRLVALKMKVKEAWADIGVQLKKRYDLLPDLIETARKATVVDEKILTKVTELRAKAMEDATKNVDPKVRSKVENELTGMMKGIKVQVEAYPDIKSHTELVNLMDKVTEIEEKIAYARRFYNSNVLSYNTKIKMFPVVLMASVFGFKEEEFFATTKEEREDIKVNFAKK